jgi:hypothetical protein
MARFRPQLRKRIAAQSIALAIAASTGAALILGAGTANAALDNATEIVTADGLSIEARQSDTNIQFMAPLDGNPLTREWTHSGVAGFRVGGGDTKDFSGKIALGYQVGYPATLSGQLKFSYSTPSLGLSIGSDSGPTIGNLIPTLGVEISAGFGPGVQTVEVASGSISGAQGSIRIAGFHGTVTGVLGQTNVRPYVTVTSSRGDSVTTYGKAWAV